MNLLVLALESALVLVILLIAREVIRLRREIGHSRMALPRIDEIQGAQVTPAAVRQSIQADNVEMLADRLDKLRDEVEKFTGADGPEAPIESESVEPETEPAPVEEEPVVFSRPAPRVLSEAGRATYEKVLHLAASGLSAESIAGEVDLTIAEVEVMLGTVPRSSGRNSGRNL